jgi:hypothetical protein
VIDRGGLGEYYDVQGSSWTDSPLLSDPSQTVQIGSRTYSLYYAGEQIRTIAWHEDGAAYWIQNTLTNSIGPHEMLAMAEQTLPVVTLRPNSSQATPAIPTLRDLKLPPREIAATSLTSKLAAALGFVGLGAVFLLALIVLSRRRELILLREQIAQAMTLEARQRPLLATTAGAGVPIPAPEPALTIYHARKRWRREILLAVAVVIVVGLVAAAGYLLQAGPFATSTPSRLPSRPPIPVAVFNATSTPGAAHGIADQLKAARVQLGEVGNINASLGAGVYVFYPPGARTQARRVAHLISRLSPTVAPIQPQVQSAVGKRNQIVVIFD